MRFRTFLVTGIEVLHLGGQNWESNAWPPEHWRKNKGRWRLFTMAIDEYLSAELRGLKFGPTVGGLVMALEVADFASWPTSTFAAADASPSYKPKHRDLWCFGKLNWPDIQSLTLKQQYEAYVNCVIRAIERVTSAKRKPRDFDVDGFRNKVAEALARGKPSHFTRAAYHAASDA
jgi:hypothetical protein